MSKDVLIKLEAMTVEQIDVILKGLGELTAKESGHLLVWIQQQARAQFNAAKSSLESDPVVSGNVPNGNELLEEDTQE